MNGKFSGLLFAALIFATPCSAAVVFDSATLRTDSYADAFADETLQGQSSTVEKINDVSNGPTGYTSLPQTVSLGGQLNDQLVLDASAFNAQTLSAGWSGASSLVISSVGRTQASTLTPAGKVTDDGATASGSSSIAYQFTLDASYRYSVNYILRNSSLTGQASLSSLDNEFYLFDEQTQTLVFDEQNKSSESFAGTLGPAIYQLSYSSDTHAVSANGVSDSSADLSDQLSFDLTNGVPEPSTWAMMILGFAGLGFVAHQRKSKATLIAA